MDFDFDGMDFGIGQEEDWRFIQYGVDFLCLYKGEDEEYMFLAHSQQGSKGQRFNGSLYRIPDIEFLREHGTLKILDAIKDKDKDKIEGYEPKPDRGVIGVSVDDMFSLGKYVYEGC